MMTERRSGAFAAGAFTLMAFLLPPLFAPGPLGPARLFAVGLALWFGFGAWRVHGREDIAEALPYRIRPVAPGVILLAALLLLIPVINAWAPAGAPGALEASLRQWWGFPFSPVGMYWLPADDLPPVADDLARGVALALSAALVGGAVIGALGLIGGVARRETLRNHALVWRGARPRATGAADPAPDDPLAGFRAPPVSGRLWLRAASLLVALVCLSYAPVFARLLAGSRIPQVEAALASPLVSDPFTPIWLTGLWAVGIAAALVFAAAYLRLGFILMRR